MDGGSASVALTFTGYTASNLNQEIDLTVDAQGDLLAIEPTGAPLIVTPAVLWTGTTASQTA